MKTLVTTITALALAALMIAPAIAETEVDVSGQIRIRGEFDDKSFDTAKTFSDYHLMRTRVNISAKASDNATGFIQFQDSRVLGGTNQSDD